MSSYTEGTELEDFNVHNRFGATFQLFTHFHVEHNTFYLVYMCLKSTIHF